MSGGLGSEGEVLPVGLGFTGVAGAEVSHSKASTLIVLGKLTVCQSSVSTCGGLADWPVVSMSEGWLLLGVSVFQGSGLWLAKGCVLSISASFIALVRTFINYGFRFS